MAETESTPTHAPMDPKKKKIMLGVGAFGVVVLGYLWYKNRSSSTATSTATPVTGSGITSYVAPVDTTGSYGGTMPSTESMSTPSAPITNTFSPSITNVLPAGTNAGGTVSKKPVATVQHKGGKNHIHVPVHKPAVHISGGTIKKSGTTSTAKGHKVATHPAQVRRLPASHSGNFVVPHNVKK